MFKRRDALKFGLAAAGTGVSAQLTRAAEQYENRPFPQSGLVRPNTRQPSIVTDPSPEVIPFQDPLFVMPTAQPQPVESLDPPPDPMRHQRYDEFPPVKFYTEVQEQRRWQYSQQPPYDQGTWSMTMNGNVPGPTYKETYGEPVLVRRINNQPNIGEGPVNFTVPSTTIHLHNAHTASESDGIPMDYINPGEFWDHHYANFRAGFDDRETMNTLWYHDHRLDFTATNVYAGLSGFYLLFDERDSGNEEDPNPNAFRLPSGKYDVPLILHDVQFDQNAQVVWDFFTPAPEIPENVEGDGVGSFFPTPDFTTNGMLGDRFTVNRTIQPFFRVEPRKYRFRILNGGPSRLYTLKLEASTSQGANAKAAAERMFVLSNDGNFYPEPLELEDISIWVANRQDVVIDFSSLSPGDTVDLVNILESDPTGLGPSGRLLSNPDKIMQFQVVAGEGDDPSQIPDQFRPNPTPPSVQDVRRERLFVFDYDNNLFTINGELMDPNRITAAIEQGSAEVWTFRNAGDTWSHPIHSHFEEFRIFEVNGRPVKQGDFLDVRKDVVSLGPRDEIKLWSRWRDFFGRHVMHCHNVVHEDHAMMIRWDIVGRGHGN